MLQGTYNVIQKEPAVWIVPVTVDGKMILLNHYRHTVNDWYWEIPVESVKQGQTIEEAAREEFCLCITQAVL